LPASPDSPAESLAGPSWLKSSEEFIAATQPG
jgi:hypothetical protein